MAAIRQQSPVVGFLLRFLISAVALAVAAWIVPGINYDGLGPLLAAAAIFGVVNAVIKPAVSVLTCPLVVLTLGLFIFVINALMLMLTDWFANRLDVNFSVDGFGSALFGAIIISIVSWAISAFLD